jgi:hypothetical protein
MKLRNIILTAAQEESSVFDVLSEARQELLSDNSYREMLEIYDKTISELQKMESEGIINFYNIESDSVSLSQALNDIYKSFCKLKTQSALG